MPTVGESVMLGGAAFVEGSLVEGSLVGEDQNDMWRTVDLGRVVYLGDSDPGTEA